MPFNGTPSREVIREKLFVLVHFTLVQEVMILHRVG